MIVANQPAWMHRVNLPEGLYDLLLTDSLQTRLDDATASRELLAGNAAEWLGELIGRQLAAVLDELPGDGSDKLATQLAMINELLVSLRTRLNAQTRGADAAALIDPVTIPARVLKSIPRRRFHDRRARVGGALFQQAFCRAAARRRPAAS